MNKKDLIKLLKAKPMKFTYAEIEQMMNEELSKAPVEMDTDFVDLCADVLCKALSNEADMKKHRRLRLAKIVSIAAVVAIIINIAIPVSAKYINNEASDKIVQFYENHFSINLKDAETNAHSYSDTDSDLISELKGSGFDNIILPSALLENDYTYNINTSEDEEILIACVTLKNQNDNKEINIAITKYKHGINNLLNSDIQVTDEYVSAKQLTKNGMDILVFSNTEHSTITYIDKDTDYAIVLNNNSIESAIEIADSIE